MVICIINLLKYRKRIHYYTTLYIRKYVNDNIAIMIISLNNLLIE